MNMLARNLKIICLLGLLILTVKSALAESTDQWLPITHNLPNTDVRALTFSQGDLYAGTWGDGVFRYDPDTLTWIDVSQGLPEKHVSHLEADSLGNLYGFVWPETTGTGIHGLSQLVVRTQGSDSWQVIDLGAESSGFYNLGLAIDSFDQAYLSIVGYDDPGVDPSWRYRVYKLNALDFVPQELGKWPDHEWQQFSGAFAFSDTGTVYAANGVLSGVEIMETEDDFETRPIYHYVGHASYVSAMTWHDGDLWVAGSNPKPEIYRFDSVTQDVETMPAFPVPPSTYEYYGTVEDIVIRGSEEVFAARSSGSWYSEPSPPWEPGEGGVFRLHDDRTGWSDVSRGLVQPADVYALRLGPDGQTMYAATDGGVFTSTDLVPVELSAFTIE